MGVEFIGEGDILKADLQTITCPVNTVGVMGAGLALAFKLRVPGLFEFYREACRSKELVIGKPLIYKSEELGKQILLFPSKKHWSQPSKREYIEEGLKYIAEHYEEMGIESLGLVPVGCGLGQLDLVRCLQPMVNKMLDDLPIPVYLLIHRRR